MAKYTSDTNLIKGAAAAYRDYSNMPGMYSGLDKLTKAGSEMITGAVKDFETEQAEIKKEQQKAIAEKKKQDMDWYNISGKVYENAGSFMKDVEYKDVANQISGLKERYIAAQESGNAEEMAGVMIEFNNIKSNVDDHKAFRETITDPEYGISDAMKHSGVKPGDNGEDHNFLTGLIKEDYEITRENGETYYNVGGVKKTMKEIKDMTILKDNIPYAAYSKAVNDFSKAKNWDRDNAEYHVRNNVIPQNKNGLRAFLADNGFGNGQTFSQVLNAKGNRASIEKEIMNSVFNTDGGGIDDKEWENFTNAIVDPKNEFWKGDEQAWEDNARRIATEQLTNGIENKWAANQPPEEIDIKGATLSAKGSTELFQKDDWIKNSVIKSLSDNINNRSEIPLAKGEGTMKWSDDDKAYIYTSDDGVETIIEDKDQLFKMYFGSEESVSTQVVGQDWWKNITDWSASGKRQKDTFSSTTNITLEDLAKDDNVIARNIQKMMPKQFTEGNKDNLYFDVTRDTGLFGGDKRRLGTGPLSESGQFWQEDTGFEGFALYGEDDVIKTYPKVYPKGAIVNGVDMSGKPHPKADKKVKIETGGSIANRKKSLKQIEDILATFGLTDKMNPKTKSR